jgi:fluoride exporter
MLPARTEPEENTVERLMPYAWVALGGALGSVARAWVSTLAGAWLGSAFPWGTLVINIAGSTLIGWYAVAGGDQGWFTATENSRAFVMAGICGGFTTFSAFSLQTLTLLQSGETGRAMAYIAASVALCLLGVWLGAMLGRA